MTTNPVILIGGPPGAGKTTLARALGRELGRKALTADDLMTAARAIATPESHPWLFRVAAAGHVQYFTSSSPVKLIADATEYAAESWPVIERVIRHHRASKTPLVLDWWLLEPAKVAAIDPMPAAIWLYIDPAALDRRELENDWRLASDDPDSMHRNFMARSLWRNEYVAQQAEHWDQPVLRLSGTETVEEMVGAALSLMA